jgi:hypothetical protein
MPNGTGSRPKGCVFCGESGLSREHVMPRWVTRHWTGHDPTGPPVNPDQDAPHRLSTLEMVDGRLEPVMLRQYPSRPALHTGHITVRAVCKKCNNGWMAALETEAKPLITALMDHSRVRLTRNQAAALIRWCQKTSAMFDCYTPDAAVMTPAVYAALSRGEQPPGVWDIRLACVDESAYSCWSHTPLICQTIGMDDARESEVDDSALPHGVVGVQSLIVTGPVVFMVRFSAHRFRGSTSVDADYFEVDWPPAVLLNSRGGRTPRTLKPGGWPVYSQSDLQTWSLWSATRGNIPGGVTVDPDGSTWVDDVLSILGEDYKVIGESERRPLDVEELFSRTPRDP